MNTVLPPPWASTSMSMTATATEVLAPMSCPRITFAQETPDSLPIVAAPSTPVSRAAPPLPVSKKRRRVADPHSSRRSASRSTSATSSSPPRTEPSSRSSSRPPNALKNRVSGAPFLSLELPIERYCAAEDDGAVSPTASADVVMNLWSSYTAYFQDPAKPFERRFEADAPDGPPFVDLEYPNEQARERFILLQPKDKDHYNPIYDLRSTVHLIIQYFVPPDIRPQFGTDPSKIILPSEMSMFCDADDPVPDPPAPDPDATCPFGNITHGLAMAFNRRDGPAFVQWIDNFNHFMWTLKYDGENGENCLMRHVKSWNGIYPKLAKAIVEQAYQRCVGPRIKDLRNYQAFSSNVYGEIMPDFVSDILSYTGVKAGSKVLDLGCGVGNVVLQTAIQAGCTAMGIEIMEKPCQLARDQLEHLRLRARLWGVNLGPAEVIQGDFCKFDLSRHLQEADVVIVNNYAFRPELNDELSRLFLDLKEGAMVVSLKPIVPQNFRLRAYNAETVTAIFRPEEREYAAGTVSWCMKGGVYFINHVDRSGLLEFQRNMESSSSRSTRGTRRAS